MTLLNILNLKNLILMVKIKREIGFLVQDVPNSKMSKQWSK